MRPGEIFKALTRNAGDLPLVTPIYDWSLRGEAPQRLQVKPIELWPGDVQAGQALCQGLFTLNGDQIDIASTDWSFEGLSEPWLNHIHGFGWLRDLKAVGGDKPRRYARLMIERWLDEHGSWQKSSWRPDRTGERIGIWLSLYEFFVASADEHFQQRYFQSLIKQARHLARTMDDHTLFGIKKLKALKGLLFAGLAFESYESWAHEAIQMLCDEINRQLRPDGMHASRAPGDLLKILQLAIDIRCTLKAARMAEPDFLNEAIRDMTLALRMFRYADRGLGVFHGTQESRRELIDNILGQANIRGKVPKTLKSSGYERLSMGRTTLLVDAGVPADPPYDIHAHASPLAFELTYGRERLFVSCGTHMVSEDWRQALRATAAHNTVTIDDRNSCEISNNGGHICRKPAPIIVHREDNKESCVFEASHDGYKTLFGIHHRRRLHLKKQGLVLDGKDIVSSQVCFTCPLNIAVRFHIHPRVMVSLIQDGKAALLRQPGGTGWRFHCESGKLALENSIYLGEGGMPRKTKQLVVYHEIGAQTAEVNWTLQREG